MYGSYNFQNLKMRSVKNLKKYIAAVFLLLFAMGCSSVETNKNNVGSEEYILYTLADKNVYSNVNKENNIANLEKGQIIYKFDYYKNFNMFYLEDSNIKGWISTEDISTLRKCSVKLIILEDNTTTFDSMTNTIKNTYEAGSSLNAIAYDENRNMYFLDDKSWVEVDKTANLYCVKNSKKISTYSNTLFFGLTLLEITILLSL